MEKNGEKKSVIFCLSINIPSSLPINGVLKSFANESTKLSLSNLGFCVTVDSFLLFVHQDS